MCAEQLLKRYYYGTSSKLFPQFVSSDHNIRATDHNWIVNNMFSAEISSIHHSGSIFNIKLMYYCF